ncbi:hypothetical protein [Desulfocurvus sp. DL9XJH121]
MDEKWPEIKAQILKTLEEKGHVTDLIKLSPEAYDELYAMAKGAYASGDYAQAETMFMGMAMFKATDPKAWLGFAGACESQKKWDVAAACYAMVVGQVIGDPVAPYRAGVCLMNLGRAAEARQMFELAASAREDMRNDARRMPYVQRAEHMLEVLGNQA